MESGMLSVTVDSEAAVSIIKQTISLLPKIR